MDVEEYCEENYFRNHNLYALHKLQLIVFWSNSVIEFFAFSIPDTTLH